jgi:hypothetical protein
MVSYSVPAEVVTPQGYGALGIHYAWIAGQRNNALSSVFNTLKIMETSKVRPRIMFIALLITFVLSFAVSAWVVLTMCYRYGALNSFRPWFFLHMPEFAGDFIRGKIEHPPAGGLVRERAFAAGIGAAIVGGLMLLRAWVPWWPIHPLGFPVADSWICQQAWLSIFVAWLLKILILKFGGLAVYRKAVPYFLGLILGQIVPVSLWVFVCWLAGGTRGIEIPIGLY